MPGNIYKQFECVTNFLKNSIYKVVQMSKRKRLTAKQLKAFNALWEKSGVTIAEFCKGKDVSADRLYAYRRRNDLTNSQCSREILRIEREKLEQLNKEWETSGMSLEKFCAEKGVRVTAIYRHRHRLKKAKTKNIGTTSTSTKKAETLVKARKKVKDLQTNEGTLIAPDFLTKAVGHLQDRAVTYDNPEGERSMAKTVAMFNALTDVNITEEQGWKFMALLKLVRSEQGNFKADNFEDGSAYVALAGEAASKNQKYVPKLGNMPS